MRRNLTKAQLHGADLTGGSVPRSAHMKTRLADATTVELIDQLGNQCPQFRADHQKGGGRIKAPD
jgi:hypothetical protein